LGDEENNIYKMGRFGLLSLALSRGVTNLPIVVIGMVLIEIATTYDISVGMAGQLTTAFSVIAIIFSLLMGILSMRYNHKKLLLFGLSLYVFTATVCLFVNSFRILVFVFAVSGVATAIAISMPNALIGELLPVEKRTGAIGLTLVTVAIMFLLGAPATDLISTKYGWRSAIFLVISPLAILTISLVYMKIPSVNSSQNHSSSIKYLEGFKEIVESRSAIACLIGTVLGLATFNLWLVYGSSLWRQVYGVSMRFISIIMVFLPLPYIAGCIVTDRLAKKTGKKRLCVISTILMALFTAIASNAPNIWLSIIVCFFSNFSGGIMFTVSTSLTLEQLPKNMGTMMSTHAAAVNMGAMVASIIGGIVLLPYSYSVYGIIMGGVGIIGALFFLKYTIEPGLGPQIT
jgi:predicted MFS family arabinose efflux permease